MNILHICNDYCGSMVHANLYAALDKQGVRQTVYTYCRTPSLEGKNKFEAQNTDFFYRPILNTYHRILYHKKICDVYADLKSQLTQSLQKYDLIHATTLFSDGAMALRLNRDHGIPYIVTVRNTDINEFLGYAPHTWKTGLEVLIGAKKIIFISKALKEKFSRHFIIKRYLPDIESKMLVFPNGIDDFWLAHLKFGAPSLNHHILYVGRFDRNKNVVRLIKAVLSLRNQYPDIVLHLVGGDGRQQSKIKKYVHLNSGCLIYHGKVFDKDKLRDLYHQCSIFAMPSIHETFGLVYIEAMSQNLAVLYTRNQGIDGLFDAKVGEAVNAWSVESIREGLDKLLSKRAIYSIENVDFERFRWSRIAAYYKSLYEDLKTI